MFNVIRHGKTQRTHSFTLLEEVVRYINRTRKGASQFTIGIQSHDAKGRFIVLEQQAQNYKDAQRIAADDEIIKVVLPAAVKEYLQIKNAQGAIDTLQELATWIQQHPDDAATQTEDPFNTEERSLLSHVGCDIVEAIVTEEPGVQTTYANIAFRRTQEAVFNRILEKATAGNIKIVGEADAYTDEEWLSYNIQLSVDYWAKYYEVDPAADHQSENDKMEIQERKNDVLISDSTGGVMFITPIEDGVVINTGWSTCGTKEMVSFSKGEFRTVIDALTQICESIKE